MTLPAWANVLSEGVILVEEGRVTGVNRAATELLELRHEVLGTPLIGVLRDHRLERAYLSGQEAECELRGRVLLAKPFTGGLLLENITDVRRAQESARELLAVLSHELRTPVSILRSTLEALASDVPDKLREKFLARAETEGDRLVRLLEDLTVDVKPPQYRRISVAEVVTRAEAVTARIFAEHSVHLSVRVDEVLVWADQDKLLQVLINLLENAAVHGPDRASVLLEVRANEAAGFAYVTVKDEGEPLLESEVAQLFEPHARGGAKAKGTGLGLYIVRSIAERWGGEAWGRPLEAGNEFGVSVPLKR